MSSITINEEKLLKGERFSTGHLFTSLTNGQTVNFIIRVPAGYDKAILLDPIRVGCTAQFTAQKYRNRTASADGTAVNVVNKNFNSSKTTSVEAFHSNTLNADGEAFNPENVGSSNTVGGDTSIGADYLAPGNSLVIQLTNEGSSGENVSIDINFVEVNV